MATTQANINIAVNGQQQITGLINSLDNLKAKTEKVNSVFAGLKTAVGAIALGSIINNVLHFADTISDLSKTTGIAVQNLLGFQAAVIANGGDAEAATKGILKLVQSIDDAAGGSLDAQDAFKEVGVSLEDLRKLSEQDLLAKVIKGLEGVDSVSKRVGLSNQLLGKSFKGVDVKGLAGDYDSATAAAVRHAAAVKAAGDVQDKLDAAFGNFKLAVLSALKPLADFLNTLKPEQINAFVDAIVKIGGAAVAFVAVSKVVSGLTTALTFLGGAWATMKGLALAGITSISTGWTALTSAVSFLVTPLVNLVRYFGLIWSSTAPLVGVFARIGAIVAALGVELSGTFGLFAAALAPLILGFGKIALVIAAVSATLYLISSAIDAAFNTKIVDTFTGAVSGAYNKLKDFLGLGKPTAAPIAAGTSTAGAGRGGNADTTAQLQAQGDAMRKQSEDARAVTDALEKQRIAIRKASGDFADYTRDLRIATDQEAAFVGMNQDQVDIIKAQTSIFAKARDEVKKLEDAKAALGDKEKGLGVVYDEQIKKINAIANASAVEIAQSIQGLQTKKLLEEDRIKNLENITKAIDDQINRSQTLGDILKSANDKLIDVNFDASIQGLGEAEKAAAQIREENRKAALEAGRAFAASFDGMDMTTAQSKELAAGLEQIADRYRKITDVQVRNAQQSRTFASGWTKAFNEFRDSATNAATNAANIFNKFTSGIEDLLVNLVKTGKFEWKSFVASMAEELLRSQIKQSLAGILDMLSSGEGIMGSIGKLFGMTGMGGGSNRGQSANAPMYVYDVSGGGSGGGIPTGGIGGATPGGGIMDTVKSVFGGVSDAVGSVFSGISSAVGGIVDSIGSIFSGGGGGGGGGFFSGLTDLFGGFFANGGMLGAGKFGVAGENGPELISGPASISPMGGTTNVTYNINAVDAMSFKAMIAADPSFIYAVSQQGAGSIPGRR
jgi:lambda family phage tail tape measure protein